MTRFSKSEGNSTRRDLQIREEERPTFKDEGEVVEDDALGTILPIYLQIGSGTSEGCLQVESSKVSPSCLQVESFRGGEVCLGV